MSLIFMTFTKKQQHAIDIMIELHTLNHDDIGVYVSRYILDKLTEMGVFNYDKSDHFWDFSNAFHSYLVTTGVIDPVMSERIHPASKFTIQIADENEAQEGLSDAITGVSETHTDVIIMEDYKVILPLYGSLTIAEVVEAYEINSPVKVVRAYLENDIVTLTFEPIPHDDEFDDDDYEGFSWQLDTEGRPIFTDRHSS